MSAPPPREGRRTFPNPFPGPRPRHFAYETRLDYSPPLRSPWRERIMIGAILALLVFGVVLTAQMVSAAPAIMASCSSPPNICPTLVGTATAGEPAQLNGTTVGGGAPTFATSASILIDGTEATSLQDDAYVPSAGDIFVDLHASSRFGPGIKVIDGTSHSVTAFVGKGSGSGPDALAYVPSPLGVWSASQQHNNLSVISPVTDATTTTSIATDDGVTGLAYGHGEVFAAAEGSDYLDVFNTTIQDEVAEVDLGASPFYGNPFSVAYDSAKGEAYVGLDNDIVAIVNYSTNEIVGHVWVGSAPQQGILYDPEVGEVFVANKGSANVSVINDTTNTVVANIPTGANPLAFAYSPGSPGYVFVTNYGSDNVSVIDDATNEVVASVGLGNGGYPYGAAFDPTDDQLFVPQSSSAFGNVTVVQETVETIAWCFADHQPCVQGAPGATVGALQTTGTFRNPIHTWSAAGTYDVKVWFNSSAGDVAISFDVTVVPAYTLSATVTGPTFPIVGTSPSYLAVAGYGDDYTAPYTWTIHFGDGTTPVTLHPADIPPHGAVFNFTHLWATVGDYELVLFVNDTNSVEASVHLNITVQSASGSGNGNGGNGTGNQTGNSTYNGTQTCTIGNPVCTGGSASTSSCSASWLAVCSWTWLWASWKGWLVLGVAAISLILLAAAVRRIG